MVIINTSCQRNSSVDKGGYNQEPGCPTIEFLSETPSPDGKLRAAVFKYEDTCQKSWGQRAMVSVSLNDGSTPHFKPYAIICYGGGLRAKWTGNKELLVSGGSKYPQYNKNGFGNINVPVNNGETITHKVGWFDSVQVTYKEENFRIQNEFVMQIERPAGFSTKVNQLATKATIYRRKCLWESDQTVYQENLFVNLDNKPLKLILNNESNCGALFGDVYKTAIDDQIDLKWLSQTELLIIGSQPNDEKKIIDKQYGDVSIKYQ
jgi:hypothetical protein